MYRRRDIDREKNKKKKKPDVHEYTSIAGTNPRMNIVDNSKHEIWDYIKDVADLYKRVGCYVL